MENNEINLESFNEQSHAARRNPSMARLWWGLALAVIGAIVLLAIGISGGGDALLGAIVIAVFVCPFLASLPLEDSTPRNVMFWMAHKSISFPGLIWEFSLDGFMWLIGMKILFAIVGFIFGIICSIIGFIVAVLISPFSYGFNVYSFVKESRS